MKRYVKVTNHHTTRTEMPGTSQFADGIGLTLG
jgi:hypothetical protein